jgi:two-component system, cell cycle response regulator DivK
MRSQISSNWPSPRLWRNALPKTKFFALASGCASGRCSCYAHILTNTMKHPTRVLFVEDDPATRVGYAAHLASLGYNVQPTGTGREALAFATAWLPDVVVLDLGLPDIDGWEVARQLKAAPTTVGIPIVALTAADLTHERISAMRAGCERYLTKPCEPADLIDAIERCIASAT